MRWRATPSLPIALRGRPLQDPQVVGALESVGLGGGGAILGGLFLVAAVVTLLGIVPTLWMRDRTTPAGRATMPDDALAQRRDDDGVQAALSL